MSSVLYKKNMIHFNDNSWHYRLVLYVFGKNFFTERDTIDADIFDKTNNIVWTRKPKLVNFCHYHLYMGGEHFSHMIQQK